MLEIKKYSNESLPKNTLKTSEEFYTRHKQKNTDTMINLFGVVGFTLQASDSLQHGDILLASLLGAGAFLYASFLLKTNENDITTYS